MLYPSYKDVPWDYDRWPNFSPEEPKLACSCCGEFYLDPIMFDRLQAVRNLMGPLTINSGHRCEKYNSKIGGAKRSQHLKLAFDVAIKGYDRYDLYYALEACGFTSFGLYKTFIHADMRPGPKVIWYGKEAQVFWPKLG